MLDKLITFASELAVGQILLLTLYNDIFFFSRLSRRVAETGWKALPAKFKYCLYFEILLLLDVPDSEGTVLLTKYYSWIPDFLIFSGERFEKMF